MGEDERFHSAEDMLPVAGVSGAGSADVGAFSSLPSLSSLGSWLSSSTEHDQYYLLLRDVERTPNRSSKKKGTILCKGTLLKLSKDAPSSLTHLLKSSTKNRTVMKSVESDKVIKVECVSGDVANITKTELLLLMPVASTLERLKIYADKTRLQLGLDLNIGKPVDYEFASGVKRCVIPGIVRYKGPVEDDHGIWFGVELTQPVGSSDGSFKRIRYFHCHENCAVFVAINKLFPFHEEEAVDDVVAKLTSMVHCGNERPAEKMITEENQNFAKAEEIAAKTAMIKTGDMVWVETAVAASQGKKKWTTGKVVYITTKDFKEPMVVVDLLQERPSVKFSGSYKEKHIFTPSNRANTIFVELSTLMVYYCSGSPPYKRDKIDMTKSAQAAVSRQHENRITTLENVAMTQHDKDKQQSKDYASHGNQPENKRDLRTTEQGQTPGEESCKKVKGKEEDLLSTLGNFISYFTKESVPLPVDNSQIREIQRKIGLDLIKFCQALGLKEKDYFSIFQKEYTDFFRLKESLTFWWKNQENPHEAKQVLVHTLRDFEIEEVADTICGIQGHLDEKLCGKVALHIGNHWHTVGSYLGLTNAQLFSSDSSDLTDHEHAIRIVDTWCQQNLSNINKLDMLISALRKSKFGDFADEVEQGLPVHYLHNVAENIRASEWKEFGQLLGLSDYKLNAFNRAYSLKQRVYFMLLYWIIVQPLEVDKLEAISSALQKCGKEQVAFSLTKGIQGDQLKLLAEYIRSDWKQLAAVCSLSPRQIEDVMLMHNPANRAYRTLLLWRWQPSTNKNRTNELYEILKTANLHNVAQFFVDGLDNETVLILSIKLQFDWKPLALKLNFMKFDIEKLGRQQLRSTDTALAMLQEWLEKVKMEQNRCKQLCSQLKAISRKDLADWLESRKMPEFGSSSTATITKKSDLTDIQKINLDRALFEQIAEKLTFKNQQDILHMLKLSKDDEKRIFQVKPPRDVTDCACKYLSYWFKQKRTAIGKDKAVGALISVLSENCQNEAATVILSGSYESSVDPAMYDEVNTLKLDGAEPMEVDTGSLTLNSMVEVEWGGQLRYGVIRWIGNIGQVCVAGIEVEDYLEIGGTNGTFDGLYCFYCEDGKGLFVPLWRCKPDGRFPTLNETFHQPEKLGKEDFGNFECEEVPGPAILPPLGVPPSFVGRVKGIQGDHNSCYMDVTLYSMFAYSSIFDQIFSVHDPTTEKIRKVLREKIVNPLRSNGFVRADHILEFREMLNDLSKLQGLTTEEKDPEEFLHALLQELLNTQPYLKIRNGTSPKVEETFIYQIFLENKDCFEVPTVEQILLLSFLDSGLKLTEVPECLILQLPRYGKNFKMFNKIIPSLELNISSILENYPRQCKVCGRPAVFECKQCKPGSAAEEVISSFCEECCTLVKGHKNNHRNIPLKVPNDFKVQYNLCDAADPDSVQDLFLSERMELFAVVCIETSHYVAFVKTGEGNAQWVFFDSMADREGNQRGFNVPEVKHIRNFKEVLGECIRDSTSVDQPGFPKHMKRLLTDAYICFYRKLDKKEDKVTDSPKAGAAVGGHGINPYTASSSAANNGSHGNRGVDLMEVDQQGYTNNGQGNQNDRLGFCYTNIPKPDDIYGNVPNSSQRYTSASEATQLHQTKNTKMRSFVKPEDFIQPRPINSDYLDLSTGLSTPLFLASDPQSPPNQYITAMSCGGQGGPTSSSDACKSHLYKGNTRDESSQKEREALEKKKKEIKRESELLEKKTEELEKAKMKKDKEFEQIERQIEKIDRGNNQGGQFEEYSC